MTTKKITLNELRSLIKQIIKEENGLIYEGLGDAYLDKLFYNEHPYPNTKEKIIAFLNKHKPKMSDSEKKYYIDRYLEVVNKNNITENVDEEIKDIKDNIELYDDNYNVYRRRYLQTQSDDDRYKMNKWLNLRKEQEKLLKDKLG